MVRMVIMDRWTVMMVGHRLRPVVRVIHGPILFIVNSVGMPIRVFPFPIMEAMQPVSIHDHPYISRTQVIILVTHDANVFITIPIVTIRSNDLHRHGRWRRWGRN